MNKDPLNYALLYSDRSGISHFKDEEIPWHTYGGGAIALRTPFQDAERIGFLHVVAGVDTAWHPAPRKQFIMVLRGVLEITAGDGERRVFTAGTVLLVADTEGQGHCTNALGVDEVFAVWVIVP